MKLVNPRLVVVVTNADSSMGLATVQAMGADGIGVVASARKWTAELEAAGAQPVIDDPRNRSAAVRLVQVALERFGRIDALVNNLPEDADVDLAPRFLSSNDTSWAQALDNNLLAPMRTTRAALPSLMATQGLIVNITDSELNFHTQSLQTQTARSAFLTFSRSLVHELEPVGVGVALIVANIERRQLHSRAGSLEPDATSNDRHGHGHGDARGRHFGSQLLRPRRHGPALEVAESALRLVASRLTDRVCCGQAGVELSVGCA